jgi:hypothetical protein
MLEKCNDEGRKRRWSRRNRRTSKLEREEERNGRKEQIGYVEEEEVE